MSLKTDAFMRTRSRTRVTSQRASFSVVEISFSFRLFIPLYLCLSFWDACLPPSLSLFFLWISGRLNTLKLIWLPHLYYNPADCTRLFLWNNYSSVFRLFPAKSDHIHINHLVSKQTWHFSSIFLSYFSGVNTLKRWQLPSQLLHKLPFPKRPVPPNF